MTLRRFTAMAVALTTMVANVARADAACDTPVAHSAVPAAAPVSEHHGSSAHAGMDHGDTASHESEPPCDDALERDCCLALASCATMFSAEDAAFVVRAPLSHDGPPIAISRSHPSRFSAPEPPPPKA